jgi:large subunit ribosomal protein L4
MTAVIYTNYATCDFRNPNPSSEQAYMSIGLRTHTEAPKYLIHRVLVVQNENKRRGTASCKTRSEVTGSGRKPWKQKGTGRARSGSSKSPLWKGGGVTFGPKSRVYRKKINTKERQLALRTALHSGSNRITIMKNFSFNSEKPSTKQFLMNLNRFDSNISTKKVLLLLEEVTENILLSSRNLKNFTLASTGSVCLRDILDADVIFISEEGLINFTSI